MIISIKVQTQAKHSRIVAFEDDCLKIQVSAVPEKGKANQALIKLLAKQARGPLNNLLYTLAFKLARN